jgi:hypothetical protein
MLLSAGVVPRLHESKYSFAGIALMAASAGVRANGDLLFETHMVSGDAKTAEPAKEAHSQETGMRGTWLHDQGFHVVDFDCPHPHVWQPDMRRR